MAGIHQPKAPLKVKSCHKDSKCNIFWGTLCINNCVFYERKLRNSRVISEKRLKKLGLNPKSTVLKSDKWRQLVTVGDYIYIYSINYHTFLAPYKIRKFP